MVSSKVPITRSISLNVTGLGRSSSSRESSESQAVVEDWVLGEGEADGVTENPHEEETYFVVGFASLKLRLYEFCWRLLKKNRGKEGKYLCVVKNFGE